MPADAPSNNGEKASPVSRTDVAAEAKIGGFGANVQVSTIRNIRKVRVRRGQFLLVSLEGGKYTAMIRRMINGKVRYGILDNDSGITVEMGELP
jgi:hypothetical protein